MDETGESILTKILEKDEKTAIPDNVCQKIEKFFDEQFEDFLRIKALGEAAKNQIDEERDKFNKKIEELSYKIEDDEAKLHISQKNVNELREQLDSAREEITKLLESTKRYELEAVECRREKNDVLDERDSLMKMIERRNGEVERLQIDIKTYETQLQAAISSKCDALTKLDEIQGKEVSLAFKEKRMDQEKVIMTNQIQSLSDDLNRTMSELQTIRRDNTVRSLELETKLNEKIEELKIANSTINHLNETISTLTAKAEELAAKLMAQGEESARMMDYYKKELQAKNKLADLYKETSDDHANEINELSSAVTELKKLLNDASEQYGELETKLKETEMRHEQEIDDKNNFIQSLRDELKHANDLLKEAKDENMVNAVNMLAPSAAVTTRLIKSDMSLTELYSKYVKATEELQFHRRDNTRLNLQIKSIIAELEEQAPMLSKKSLEYQKLQEANIELSNHLEIMIREKVEMRDELQEVRIKLADLQRENKKLIVGQKDLGRQVCYLLKEVEQSRGSFTNDNNVSITSDMPANEVISKRLVTFSDIAELQENNQKLILLVRDLSSKLEEMEELQNNIDQASYESKLSKFTNKIKEMNEIHECHRQMLSVCMVQRDRYKKQILEPCKNCGKSNSDTGEGSLNHEQMDGVEDEITPLASNTSTASSEAIAGKEKRITELEEQVKRLNSQIKVLKEEYDEYKKEKLTNEKMMNEQFDSMRTELRELTSSNCKLMSKIEYNNEQMKIQQANLATYKKQIGTLEERNKNYESTIIKHEQTMVYLRDEAMDAQKALGAKEVQVDNLKQECRLLRDIEARLQLEREALHRERQTQGLLLNNLEMIKASFERSENEGRLRVEHRLDEAVRECSALRRRLQEEQDRFRELTVDLNRQTDLAKERMEEERNAAAKLREEVLNLREDLESKSKQINDLSKKLQESLTPSLNDNPIAQANKKAREIELKFEVAMLEMDSLSKELVAAREHAQQYCKMSESSEKELKELHDRYSEYKSKAEVELKVAKASELDLKSRIQELETEIQLQITTVQLNTGTTTVQVHKVQGELKEALQKIGELNRELRDVREQNHMLNTQLQSVEQKYANEMILHSSDIQELSKVKEELQKIRDQISQLKFERDEAVSVLNEKNLGWKEREAKFLAEIAQVESRFIDLNAQNTALHQQVEALSTKLSLASFAGDQQVQGSGAQSVDGSMNESNIENSFGNRSVGEDENNADKLMQIIKYLRKEKDISVAKVDILKSENVRLLSEQTILQKKLDEANAIINNERTKSETIVVTTAKHEEILRKIETLNAITDSNRILREERDNLANRVKELTDRISRVEDELFPLQEKNREFTAKIEELTVENTSVRTEALRWRQRANVLIERSNKNPEDFRRLQNERESLAKMLTAEKEALRQSQEDLNATKTERVRLEAEVTNLGNQIQALTEEKKKIVDDYNTLKQQNIRVAHEVLELKNQLFQKEEDVKKLTEDSNSKEALVADAKNKEAQIRKIAKRYKDMFFELKGKVGGQIADNVGDTDAQTMSEVAGTSKPDTEKDLKDKINELNAQIVSIQEQNEILRKENETLKSNLEKDENTKQLLKEAKGRIMSLTESKNAVMRDLTTSKNQIQDFEQKYEGIIARLEKEKLDKEKETTETVLRLTRENETLLQRIRQLGMQQVSKPSTSSGATSEKGTVETPRTANVKPMSGQSVQQSATVTPWRGFETPLASIRPMSVQNSRTAAVLPTSQTSSVTPIQGSSSGSVTALVPPQQQVHTTGNSSGEAMSSSPTSSHTDYMPATSSAAVVVAAIPPMGSSAESSQEAESVQNQNNESSSTSQALPSGGQQPQTVALVSPRVEGAIPNPIPSQAPQIQDINQPSTSGASTSSNISVSSHHQASSSSTVTTTQAGVHKRLREVDGDSSTCNDDGVDKSQPQNKRTRIQIGETTFQGVTESGLEVEYQVPTSSQRDQEDDIIIVDSEDDGMVDEGPADGDDGQMEDEVDNGEGYEMEESYEQEQEIDENEGPDIDEDNLPSDNNEVEVDDSSEVPNQSGTTSSTNHVAPDGGTSHIVEQSSREPTNDGQNQENQQIQTISSGSDAGSSSQATAQTSCWRQVTPPHSLSRQQHATYLMLHQSYEETGDDGIVPSTPTLYVPRRADGFSEAVSSPHPQVPHAARFIFTESTSSRSGVVPGVNVEGTDEVRPDQCEEESGRVVPNNPQQSSPQRDSAGTAIVEGTSTTTTTTETSDQQSSDVQEAVAGPSHVEGSIPEITVTTAAEDTDIGDGGASTSEAHDCEQDKIEDDDIEEDEEEGLDNVTSEGEKPVAGAEESNEIEEGREAEASTSPSINTRSRSMGRGNFSSRRPSNRNHQRSNRPTPIIWQDHSRTQRNMNTNMRGQNDGMSPRTHAQIQQRGQRARRMRRPSGQTFGGNMRY